MPELPDIVTYVEALRTRLVGQRLERLRIAGVSLLRTADPSPAIFEGASVREVRRIGKRIVIGFDGDVWVVLHLMIGGRLHWRPPGVRLARRNDLAAFDFAGGTLLLTEAGSKRRASLHLVRGEAAVQAMSRGGLDIFQIDLQTFREVLARENHTLKRALTDPRLLDGIGNAYSDEILHAARLSPLAQTQRLTGDQWKRLFEAARATLQAWVERLRAESGENFPEGVTAFRREMAVHGRFGKPCPRCGTPIARIAYAENETNYCPVCQTGGKVLADRRLSRLLKRR